MRVLITGSSGRVGHAIASLVSCAHTVVGIDVVEGEHTQILGDIRDSELMREAMQGMDAVIHTAALHAPHVGQRTEADFRSINVDATAQLLATAFQSGVSQFVLTSSTSVYGNAMVSPNEAVWVTESLMPSPRDIYDETKLAAEDLCRQFTQPGFRTTIIRMSRCFPESEKDMAIYRLYRGVDARDVADAHLLALKRSGLTCEAYNVSGPTPFHPSEIHDLFCKADEVILKYHPWAQAEFSKRGWTLPKCIDRVYVSEKAMNELGYRPQHGFSSLFSQTPDPG